MFIPRTQATVTIPATTSTWQDTGLIANLGEVLRRIWNGTSYAQFSSPGSLRPPNGTTTTDNGTSAPSRNVTLFSVAFVARPSGSGNPGYGATGCVSYDATSADKPTDSVLSAGGRIWAVANDTNYTDNSGQWVMTLQLGSYVYSEIPQGQTVMIAVEGSYTRGSGGWNGQSTGGVFGDDYQWIVDKPDYSIAGRDTATGGWNAVLSSDGTGITVTVPGTAAVSQFYSVYVKKPDGSYVYSVFHVVPALLLPPNLSGVGLLQGNAPLIRLTTT